MNQLPPILTLGSPDILEEYVGERQTAVKLDLPEAKEAEELHALSADLEFVVRTTRYLASILRQREYPNVQEDASSGTTTIRPSMEHTDEHLVTRCLWTAALVA